MTPLGGRKSLSGEPFGLCSRYISLPELFSPIRATSDARVQPLRRIFHAWGWPWQASYSVRQVP